MYTGSRLQSPAHRVAFPNSEQHTLCSSPLLSPESCYLTLPRYAVPSAALLFVGMWLVMYCVAFSCFEWFASLANLTMSVCVCAVKQWASVMLSACWWHWYASMTCQSPCVVCGHVLQGRQAYPDTRHVVRVRPGVKRPYCAVWESYLVLWTAIGQLTHGTCHTLHGPTNRPPTTHDMLASCMQGE